MLKPPTKSGTGLGCAKNAKAINRDRTTYSFKIVLGAHTQGHSTFGANARTSFS